MRHSDLIPNLNLHDYNPVAFGYESCSPGHYYGPAVRSYWLLHYVSSGKGIFVREGETHILKKGDLFIIPPFIETYYEADQNTPWNYVWIGFTTKNPPAPSFETPVIHCPEAATLFEEMKLCGKKNKGKAEFLVAKLWELISLLSEETETKPDYVEQSIQYMKNEYMNSISISELANNLRIDRSYFSNIFKEQIGISPMKYLSNLRLSIAAELMVKNDTSPTTAALSCGYSDIYHFSKAFKKEFGVSPRNYIEQNKKTTPKKQSKS